MTETKTAPTPLVERGRRALRLPRHSTDAYFTGT
jgi:hypothetical protein